MTDTDVLRKMINSSAIINLEAHYKNKMKVVLEETETEDCKLEVYDAPHDAIVIDVDTHFKNDELFDCTSSECKRSDFIIISEAKNVVIFIEIKKGNSGTLGIVNQLKGGLCVFEYCQSIAREFFGENNFLNSYDKRFVAFKRVNLKKRKVSVEKGIGDHSTPETLMKLSWASTVYFNKIAA